MVMSKLADKSYKDVKFKKFVKKNKKLNGI